MSRSFKYNPEDEYSIDEESDVLLDDSQLSASQQISANSAATGDMQVLKSLSNQSSQSIRDKKRANKQLRKQRRHDERQ